MAGWQGSGRREELPANWPSLRRQALVRDGYRCQLCGARASEVDHVKRGNNHDLSNLRSLCYGCHLSKSGREGARQVWANRRIVANSDRSDDVHPGYRKRGENGTQE